MVAVRLSHEVKAVKSDVVIELDSTNATQSRKRASLVGWTYGIFIVDLLVFAHDQRARRCDKLAPNFLDIIKLASTMLWLKSLICHHLPCPTDIRGCAPSVVSINTSQGLHRKTT
ncbi:hypothetical protein IE4771_CH00816 [Rhizobium etli bv. mimosae str. IE4771]|uniref:Uncharacterized protein n=1 Tax=Rhizobium etli bv. mimosae str. IE4771 TaxID=1432050 RepID=A0A060I3B1_RHIET|nr:hypothetical protein IE4771_CH00816 [Rhizobium sp. IE4771]